MGPHIIRRFDTFDWLYNPIRLLLSTAYLLITSHRILVIGTFHYTIRILQMCTSLTREAGVPFPLIRDTMSRESVLSSSLSVSRQSNRVRGLPSNHVPYRLKPTGLSTDRSSKSSFTMNTSGINLDSLESASIQMLIAWIDQLVQDRLTHLTNPSKVDIEEFQATE